MASRNTPRIALLANDRSAALLEAACRACGTVPVVARSLSALAELLSRRRRIRLVITQTSLPDGNWRDVLEIVAGRPENCPVLVFAPGARAGFYYDALEAGAFDVLATGNPATAVCLLREALQRSGPETPRR